jgi:hypothetical protein
MPDSHTQHARWLLSTIWQTQLAQQYNSVCAHLPLYVAGHAGPHPKFTPQITVMAPWRDKDEWKSQQLLMFGMPPILLGNILDIYYQLE